MEKKKLKNSTLKKEHWYENKSLLLFFLDTPVGLLAFLKNKKLKSPIRVMGILAGFTGLIMVMIAILK